MKTCNRKHKSPSWECETDSLPPPEPMPEPSSPEPSDAASKHDKQTDTKDSRQVHNGGCRKWQPWQDRYLASEVFALRPFEVTKKDASTAWDKLEATMYKDSKNTGEQSAILCSGSACRAQMKKLVNPHKVSHQSMLNTQQELTSCTARSNSGIAAHRN